MQPQQQSNFIDSNNLTLYNTGWNVDIYYGGNNGVGVIINNYSDGPYPTYEQVNEYMNQWFYQPIENAINSILNKSTPDWSFNITNQLDMLGDGNNDAPILPTNFAFSENNGKMTQQEIADYLVSPVLSDLSNKGYNYITQSFLSQILYATTSLYNDLNGNYAFNLNMNIPIYNSNGNYWYTYSSEMFTNLYYSGLNDFQSAMNQVISYYENNSPNGELEIMNPWNTWNQSSWVGGSSPCWAGFYCGFIDSLDKYLSNFYWWNEWGPGAEIHNAIHNLMTWSYWGPWDSYVNAKTDFGPAYISSWSPDSNDGSSFWANINITWSYFNSQGGYNNYNWNNNSSNTYWSLTTSNLVEFYWAGSFNQIMQEIVKDLLQGLQIVAGMIVPLLDE